MAEVGISSMEGIQPISAQAAKWLTIQGRVFLPYDLGILAEEAWIKMRQGNFAGFQERFQYPWCLRRGVKRKVVWLKVFS